MMRMSHNRIANIKLLLLLLPLLLLLLQGLSPFRSFPSSSYLLFFLAIQRRPNLNVVEWFSLLLGRKMSF